MTASTTGNTASSLKRVYVGAEAAKARRGVSRRILHKGRIQKRALGGSNA